MNKPAVPFVDIDTLSPENRKLLDGITAVQGFIPNSMKTYLHRPEIAQALMVLMQAVMGESSTLPLSIKGKLGIICSTINGCAYCTSHQCHMVSHPPNGTAGLKSDQITELINGMDQGDGPIEAACFAYARAASLDSSSVSQELINTMQEVLSSAQIVELATVVGMWKMINTIHDSLNLPIEESVQDFAHFLNSK